MTIDSQKLLDAFVKFEKTPRIAVACFALSVPVVLLYGAAKFSSSSIETFSLFGFLGVVALTYSVWVVSSLVRNGKVESEEKA